MTAGSIRVTAVFTQVDGQSGAGPRRLLAGLASSADGYGGGFPHAVGPSPGLLAALASAHRLLAAPAKTARQRALLGPWRQPRHSGRPGPLRTASPRRAAALALILLVTALARPQTAQTDAHSHTEGIAIQLVLDTSLSMGYTDYAHQNQAISRMDAARHAIRLFVKGDEEHNLPGRSQDQIGLVGFNRYPDVLCPLTHSHDTLLASLDDVSLGPYTNIGDGLAWGLDRLRRASPKQKILILLSDGKQTAPDAMNPQAAAKLAAELGVRVYTIGAVGNQGGEPPSALMRFMNRTSAADSVDEETMKRVASLTGGKYFRATDSEGLLAVYREIDQLEKSRIEQVSTVKREDWFTVPLIAGLLGLALEALLAATRFLMIG